MNSKYILIVSLEFEWGTNLDKATNEIKNLIGLEELYLPGEVDSPTVFKIRKNMIPALKFSVTSTDSHVGIKDIIDNHLIQPLNRINRVVNIIQIGPLVMAFMVDADPRKLGAYTFTIDKSVTY